jgi:hypothetical protein
MVIAIALSALPFAANAQQATNLVLSCSGTYKMTDGSDIAKGRGANIQ